MSDEVRTEAPEKITGDLNEQVAPEALAAQTPEPKTPKVESTVSQGPAAGPTQQPMVVNPDGTRRPATPEEIQTFQRTQECGRALQELLNRYDCDLDVSMLITMRGVLPQVQIVPRTPREDSSIIRPASGIVTP
jgi:hypothetical protein